MYITFKDSIFLKIKNFILQERFDKLIYGINKIRHLIACKISVHQPLALEMKSSLMIFYGISELMLPTLIKEMQ